MWIVDQYDRRIVTEQQRKNAEFALRKMWPAVPEKNVISRLCTWRGRRKNGDPGSFTCLDQLPPELVDVVDCKTVACFGGWVAVNPYFNEQGVQPDYKGAPIIIADKEYFDTIVDVDLVCSVLFGVPYLFIPRKESEKGSDHKVVSNRLRTLIKNSVVVK